VFDHLLRLLKDRLLAPVARAMGPGVSPTLVTLLGCLVGLGAAAAAAAGRFGLALALWALNRTLDGLDGTLARVHDRQTDFGGYLDILLDFLVYAVVPIGLTYGARSHAAPWLPFAGLALLASYSVNAASWMYLSALLERRQAGTAARSELTSVTMPPGLVAGTETVVLYTLFLLFPGWLAELFTLMAVLVTVTIVQRVAWARRHL
jgi:phosphatidylglycerophosphate synthase